MNPYIYIRTLKKADHTVFCVEKGQKNYIDPVFNRKVAYSSGQQIKRSVLLNLLEKLNTKEVPFTFTYEINNKTGGVENKEIRSLCDPSYIDQLLGGWMSAGKDESIVKKRRSPLSFSAMRPLHPLLAGCHEENLTFDRSNNPDLHPVIVRMGKKLLTEEEIETFLTENDRTLGRRAWISGNMRTSGLFVQDTVVDLRTLFSVSTNQHEPELSKEKIEELKKDGWIECENAFGSCLVMPKEKRKQVIPALAEALINWRITTNQARTFSLMETLAVAISDNANKVGAAIRSKLTEDGDKPKAKAIVDENAGADTYITLPCAGYIVTESENADALDNAVQSLIDKMTAFDFENQKN